MAAASVDPRAMCVASWTGTPSASAAARRSRKLSFHSGVSYAPSDVEAGGGRGQEHDGPGSHDEGNVAGQAGIRCIAGREPIDGDSIVGRDPRRGHDRAPEPDLLEHRG